MNFTESCTMSITSKSRDLYGFSEYCLRPKEGVTHLNEKLAKNYNFFQQDWMFRTSKFFTLAKLGY